jgi:hypothetical protein
MEPHAVQKITANYGIWQSESALADDLRTRMERAGKNDPRGSVAEESGESSMPIDEYDDYDRVTAKESDRKNAFEGESWQGRAWHAIFNRGGDIGSVKQDMGVRPEHYVSPMLLANLLIGMLALQLGYFVFAALLTLKGTAGSPFSLQSFGMLQTCLFVATCVGFVAWTYRLYSNLTAFGTAGLKLNAAWAAAFMVIPVVNLIMPYRIFSEIWAASRPDVDSRNPSAWRSTPSDTFTVLAWFSFTVAFTISQVFGYLSSGPGRNLVALPLVGHVACAVSALLAIIVVWRLSTRQDDKQYQLCVAHAA